MKKQVFFFIADGKTAKYIGSAKDYKRVGDGNIGFNTGGMGCISPSPLENKKSIRTILKEIINPTLKTMNELGYPYHGILYAGVMFTKKGIFLIEYNVRLGDPECQTILDRLETDFLKICLNAEKKLLKSANINLSNKKSICVVIASKGYPEKYKNGLQIDGLKRNLNTNDETIIHAGTIKEKNKFFTNGGRVLNVVVKNKSLKLAIKNVYKKCKTLSWKGSFYRNDIGK